MPRRPGTATLARRLGARIRALRQEAGLTQEQLAWNCDFAKPYLSQIEAGKRLPSLPALIALAREIGVEPADLLAIDPKSPRTRLFDSIRTDDRAGVASAMRQLGFPIVAETSRSSVLSRVAESGTREPRRKSLTR